MRNYVARLLRQKKQPRRLIHVTLDLDQIELLEKLSLFVSAETGQSFSESQMVEEAVRAFLDESARYISEEFDMDLRETSLTEMRQYMNGTAVDVCELDTIVVPIRDRPADREPILAGRGTLAVQMDRDKIDYTKYLAFYFGAPGSAITHFAHIVKAEPHAGEPKKLLLHYDQVEELPHRLEWGDPAGKGLRRPRYTVLKMLLEAKMIEELF